MFNKLRKLFTPAESGPRPALPAGTRAYAVGDVHGVRALFAALRDAIEADDAARTAADTSVVLLGDLIDRGPDSADVIAQARAWTTRRTVRILMGNHEEMFLDALEKEDVLRHFLRFGGKETLLSYPIDPEEYTRSDLAETIALMHRAIPAEDIAFIRQFEDRIELGGYLFVHAGIRPGVPLEEQAQSDLRWIREPFLSHPDSHGPLVVHGHTIADDPQLRPNRIGIDTGAYRSGCLTALGLEGEDRWLIEARDENGAIRVTQRSL